MSSRRTKGEGDPPAPESLTAKREFGYADALASATDIEACKDRYGVTYCWMFWPSRNTWPTWHLNRPAPTPGCGCGPCHRPRCCDTWAEPVEVFTGEVVAWICAACLEEVVDRGAA